MRGTRTRTYRKPILEPPENNMRVKNIRDSFTSIFQLWFWKVYFRLKGQTVTEEWVPDRFPTGIFWYGTTVLTISDRKEGVMTT